MTEFEEVVDITGASVVVIARASVDRRFKPRLLARDAKEEIAELRRRLCTCKRVEILTVSGTWGQTSALRRLRNLVGARAWFEPGSSFCQLLHTQLSSYGCEATFSNFAWSTRNSVLERRNAARSLAGVLIARARANPETNLAVIGHSHGGNVALSAVLIAERSNVRVDVATMATPLLRVTPRSEPLLTTMAGVAFLLGAPMALFAAFSPLLTRFGASGLFLFGLAFSTSVGIGMGKAFGRLIRAPIDVPFESRREYRLSSTLTTKFPKRSRVLLLRGYNDEATWLLATASLTSRLAELVVDIPILPLRAAKNLLLLTPPFSGPRPRHHHRRLSLTMLEQPLAMLMVGAVLAFGWISFGSHLFEVQLSYEIPVLVQSVCIAYFVALLVAGVLASAALSLFGRELFLNPASVRVSAEDLPGSSNVSTMLVQPDDDSLGLHHRIYSSEEVAAGFAGWFATGSLESLRIERRILRRSSASLLQTLFWKK